MSKTNPNTAETWEQRYGPAGFRNSPMSVYERLKPTHAPLYDAILDRMRVPGGEVDILDVGAGPGVLAWLFLQRYGAPKIGRYVMLDHSDQAHRGAMGALSYHGVFDFRVVDLEKGVPDIPSNLVVCVETLEHLTNDVLVVQGIRAAILYGGRIVISVPVSNRHWLHVRGYDKDAAFGRIYENLKPMKSGEVIPFFRDGETAPSWWIVDVTV